MEVEVALEGDLAVVGVKEGVVVMVVGNSLVLSVKYPYVPYT